MDRSLLYEQHRIKRRGYLPYTRLKLVYGFFCYKIAENKIPMKEKRTYDKETERP